MIPRMLLKYLLATNLAAAGFSGYIHPVEEHVLPRDFKEFLKLLNEADAQYLLIGGYAVGYYPNSY